MMRSMAALLAAAAMAACGGRGDGESAATQDGTVMPGLRAAPGAEPDTLDWDDDAEPTGGALSAGGSVTAGAGSTLQGVVTAGGTAQETLTEVRAPDGSRVFVTGPLEGEVRAVSGGTVLVQGSLSGPENFRRMEVARYEIVQVNGERPVVGVILQDGRLAAGQDTLRLRGAVGAPAGARVWVTGERAGATFNVSSYGILRQP
jgi:hypothetical protein